MRKGCALLAAASAAALASPAAAQEAVQVQDLAELSIEELAQVTVRSAAKQEEALGSVPRALFVISNEDILNSAATSLPEVLRLAPNLQVQQLDARQYAISARGFNGYESSNKLLVLIDGRSVYTTLHSSVFWDLHAPLLEDIEQIEVISGPGGTLYGPNAVNGVVSVATMDARDTIGGLVRATAGGQERTAAARYGAALGDSAAIRFYATGFDREGLVSPRGSRLGDGFHGWQAGFRFDGGGGSDHITVQGDLFENESEQMTGDGNSGHNVLARWTRELSERSSFQLQAYYDSFQRNFLLVQDSLETFDAEAQYNAQLGPHRLVAGAGLRTTRDEFVNNLNAFRLDPVGRRLWIANVFIRDALTLTPELTLIGGVKFERSSFSGIEVLPTARLAWQVDPQTLLWASISRAVRTPSRIDRDLASLPLLAAAPRFQSEKLVALEAGYRGQPTARTSLAVSLFYNLYDDLRTAEFTGDPLPIQLTNSLYGRTYGLEAWSVHQMTSWWRLQLGAALLGKDFEVREGHVDLSNGASLGADPDFQLIARSTLDLTDRLRFNGGLRFVDDLGDGLTESYVEADARLGYSLTDGLELYVAGTNLLHESHLESNDRNRARRAERSVYAGTRLRF